MGLQCNAFMSKISKTCCAVSELLKGGCVLFLRYIWERSAATHNKEDLPQGLYLMPQYIPTYLTKTI